MVILQHMINIHVINKYDKYVNKCSMPINILFKYKKKFYPII